MRDAVNRIRRHKSRRQSTERARFVTRGPTRDGRGSYQGSARIAPGGVETKRSRRCNHGLRNARGRSKEINVRARGGDSCGAFPGATSARTINRCLSSGLQSIAIAADRIRTGGAEVIVAGLGTMSMIPMGGHTIRPNPYLVSITRTFISHMGLATETSRASYEVSREQMHSRFNRISAGAGTDKNV